MLVVLVVLVVLAALVALEFLEWIHDGFMDQDPSLLLHDATIT